MRVVTQEERAKLHQRQRAFQQAIMSTWTASELRDAVESYFHNNQALVDFIIDEGLVEDELDDYLDFASYPDHEAALVKAGLLEPWVAPEDRPDWPPEPTVPAAVMEGQPKLIEDAP